MTTNLNIYVDDARSAGDVLRVIAQQHGYVAHTGPRTGEGSASELIGAIIKGELATVLLSDEERAWFIDWLLRVQVDDTLYGDVPRQVAEQIGWSVEREHTT